ncbi:hypothetical protein [Enterococcus ureasiticus]|uniref:Uncharacterized protein n=1 Tax=Enterococcus ureasiticus TaxID=903984 RepID=A0A1E5GE65_9ENTE|nr:hypothetical protein [Enterococcus ureasiticus]OEG11004.1 hypothetical protein BCR21_12035 [Enterococcus ureasiticus]
MENKNDQERVKYSRLITEKENINDELKQEQRKIEDSLRNLQEDLQRGYRTLAMINEEAVHSENHEGIRVQRKNEEQERYFGRQLQEAEETLSDHYAEQRKTLDKETEDLYKKRGEIPWD